MTDPRLVALLESAQFILLDFDGPVCGLFANRPAAAVADELRQLLVCEALPLPPEILAERDPLAILRFTATLGHPAIVSMADEELRRGEIIAARTAEPTPYASDVVVAAHRTGRRVAVVSNNSADAVHSYLRAHRLAAYVHPVVGRREAAPERMKPDPFPVLAALHELGAEPSECVLVGDSASDIEAAHAAGIVAVGYANKPGKRDRLAAADALIGSMAELAGALGRQKS